MADIILDFANGIYTHFKIRDILEKNLKKYVGITFEDGSHTEGIFLGFGVDRTAYGKFEVVFFLDRYFDLRIGARIKNTCDITDIEIMDDSNILILLIEIGRGMDFIDKLIKHERIRRAPYAARKKKKCL
jgi:hypothetical protein